MQKKNEHIAILSYYTESPTRNRRRGEILRQAAHLFNRISYETLTMKEIAEALEIERRTLYSYYNQKIDLIIDSYLYLTETVADTKNNQGTTASTDSNCSTREQLEKRLQLYSSQLMRMYQKYPFLRDYDAFIRTIDQSGSGMARFIEVRRNIENTHHSLYDCITEAQKSTGILQSHTESTRQSRAVEQGLRAFLIRTIERRDYADHYSLENVDQLIHILSKGLTSL